MISLPKQPKILEKKDNEAVFEIENCWPGYGLTLGNALRRALLSSLPGAAIVGVKIKGAEHEFSPLPYVLEDVIEIILNLKRVRFRLNGKGPVKVSLFAKGKKEVTGKDIKTPTEAEVVNKDALIATLTDKKASLAMELLVDQGVGYVSSEEHKETRDFEAGMIAIDSIFSPVLKANYRVENMRVGVRTDFNRVIFQVQTDGTISPEEAFQKAANTLVNQFKAISKVKKFTPEKKASLKAKSKVKKEKAAPTKTREEELKSKSLSYLKLSARVENILNEAGIRTVGGLLRKREKTLEKLPGLGEKALKELRRKVGRLGLILK